nr:MAG TPA: hypothetical protein [Myoviridae sp. ctEXz2]
MWRLGNVYDTGCYRADSLNEELQMNCRKEHAWKAVKDVYTKIMNLRIVCIVLGHIRMNTKKSLYRLIGSVYDSCP